MVKSRLRPNRAKYKHSEPARHQGWSKGKTLAIVIAMALLIAFIIFVFVTVILTRGERN